MDWSGIFGFLEVILFPLLLLKLSFAWWVHRRLHKVERWLGERSEHLVFVPHGVDEAEVEEYVRRKAEEGEEDGAVVLAIMQGIEDLQGPSKEGQDD